MKKLNLTERSGFSQIFVLVGMLLVAISLPIAISLVQQNQENRSNAAEVQCESSDTKCEGGYKYTCSSHKWKKTTIKCGTTPATTCTYTVSWGACKPGGTKVGVLKASPKGCTGGTKPATVENCTYVAPVDCDSKCGDCATVTTCSASKVGCTWSYTGNYCENKSSVGSSTGETNIYYYYNGSACVSASYAKIDSCNSAHSGSACYVSLDACQKAHTASTSGVCAASEVGTYKCQNNDVWYCKQDPRTDGVKSGTWGISSNCTGGCSVVNNKAECDLVSNCTLGATKCYGGNVYECKHQTATNTGINDWTLTNTCSNGCSVDGGGKAQCDSAGCTVDETKCVGSTLYTCNKTDSGTTWKTQVCDYGCSSGKCKSGSGSSGGSSGYSSGLSVTPDTLTLKVGESATVTATQVVTWSSDTATVATVTSEGIVTGVSVGTATITATTDLGETAVVAVTVIASDTGTLSFKVAFAGIKPSYVNNSGESYSCIGSLGDLTVDVLNRVSNVSQTLSNVQVSVVGNEVDSKGNQVFQVSNLDVGSSLMGANTNNFVKVKGPFHLRRRMCTDGQSGKTDDATVCNINLFSSDSYVYDFSEYTLLAGDANLDGVINSVDFSLVKNAVNADAELECGRQYDLNMDGVVNSLDLNLVKDALSSKDDE